MREIRFAPTPDAWLAAAAEQLRARRQPSEILWTELTADQPALPGLFGEDQEESPREPRTEPSPRALSVSQDFRRLLHIVAYHRDTSKWALLYSVLWRMTTSQPRLLAIDVDAEVGRLLTMQRQVQRGGHGLGPSR